MPLKTSTRRLPEALRVNEFVGYDTPLDVGEYS
jgi:hypothetical protein